MQSSTDSSSILQIELRPGNAAWVAGAAIAACVSLSVGLSGLALPIKCFLAPVLPASLLWRYRKAPAPLERLHWAADGRWRVQDCGGRWIPARLLHARTLGPAFNSLYFQDAQGQRRLALVWPGSAPESQRRRLARHLRWRPSLNPGREDILGAGPCNPAVGAKG